MQIFTVFVWWQLLGLLAHSNSELEMVERLRVPAYQIMELERVIEKC